MNRLCYAILLLLLLTSPIAAQDDESPFPVLDEAAIFADGVTVIERLPVLNFDNETQQIYYFDAEDMEWEIYSYPDEQTYFSVHGLRSDGTYLIAKDDMRYAWEQPIEQVWLLNVETGIISKPPEQCGVTQALSNEGLWILAREETPQLTPYLCHTETGERRELHFESLYDVTDVPPFCLYNGPYPAVPRHSPDWAWIVFYTCNANSVLDYRYPVFSYEIATDIMRYLGRTEVAVDEIYIDYWLDNTTFVMGAANDHQHSFVYLANVAESDSLQSVDTTDLPPQQPTFVNNFRIIGNNTDGYIVLNEVTQFEELITQANFPDSWYFSFTQIINGELRVSVNIEQQTCGGYLFCLPFTLAQWHIRIDALDEEQP
jgi:hypothetical protein